MTSKMQSCVDHIKTSIDVDPWAAEMVEKVFTDFDERVDYEVAQIDLRLRKDERQKVVAEMLGIIDSLEDSLYTSDESMEWAAKFTLGQMRERVMKLKGGKHEDSN